jgi:O-antigen/teichoic acid export membrane protein
MAAESVSISVGGEPAARAPLTPTSGSLSRRAALTAVASLVDYAAQIAVTLLVTPIVVGSLGKTLFGVWEMLRQAVGYMTAADGRPMDALRLVVASQQANPDAGQLRRQVGAALVVWLVFLPIVLVAGTALVWLAPSITKVGPDLAGEVRIACALLVLSFIVGALASIPEAVLRGMNLGYKRMGWQAALSVSGGLLTVGAVFLGLGVLGLGAAQLAVILLTGVCFLVLARKYVPALAVSRPSKFEILSLLRMSAWLTGGLVLTNALLASDVLILGMVVSPAVVSMYVLTGAAARMAVTLFNFTVGATTPGLGGLIGEQQFERVARIRTDLVTLTWLFVTVGGATILLWNRTFVSLWVGADYFAGITENLLIVCVMVQTAFIRGDAFVIDAALRPRPRVIVTAIAAALTLAATLALTPAFGIIGLCAGILIGRLPQTIAYPRLVASCLRQSTARTSGEHRVVFLNVLSLLLWLSRRAAVTVGIFGGATWLGQRVLARDWFAAAGAGTISVGLLVAVALVAGLSDDERRTVIKRFTSMGRVARG